MPPVPGLAIARRFNGPPGSANGGYACGRLAALARAAGQLDGCAAVTLHLPVPLDSPLTYQVAGRRGHAWHGDDLVASVAAAGAPLAAPPPVEWAEARAAEEAFDATGHPFPGCFVCGTERPLDGLGLRPGPVVGSPGTVACTWSPAPDLADEEGRIRAEFVWSALDCPGGWTTDPARRPRVLGRMAAAVRELPLAGVPLVLVGRLERLDGRTATIGTALYGRTDGPPLAVAGSVWVALDRAALG
ncbi:hypothetical protein [Streptomyces sp. PTY087I2]|uniref:hypothetical protein n=1 Tax=Streptomyces sp. PTY087I2 TaxID=1819298 RepID=UPI00080B3E7F|nr:hypothetical protein [Streptomyces sp. PTY087I2]OCC13536.1 hypothetical protein A3Q37_00508 [Streptomyces sp. PTY087I2]